MIKNIGVIDHKTELFEGQYPIPNGIRYNSYLIIDEDIAILDTVDKEYSEEWLNNLDKELKGKEPKYLVVHHVEPDHSGSIVKLLDKYPNICVVGNAKTFSMLENFYPITINNRKIVNNNEVLSLYQIGATKDASITTTNTTVKTGDASYSFSGTAATLKGGYTPSGTVSQPSFSGTAATISVPVTPAGTVSKPTFSGTASTVTVS